MPDAGLRKEFHTHLRSGFQWSAIETGLTAPGVPDSHYCGGGVTGWVEHKRTDGWAVTLRPAQVGWITTHIRRGGRAFIAVRRLCAPNKSRGRVDDLWLLRGQFAREALDGGLRGLPPAAILGVWPGGPERWEWAEVSAHLRS